MMEKEKGTHWPNVKQHVINVTDIKEKEARLYVLRLFYK